MTRIAQITDPHLGHHAEYRLAGVPTLASFDAVLQSALTHDPDLLLVTGDIAAEPTVEAYELFFGLIEKTGLPMVWLPGNHDDVAVAERAEKATRYKKIHDVGNWRLVLLDSVIPGSPNGALGDAERQRFDTLMAENTQEHLLVCVHHHPIGIGSAWLDQQRLEDAEPFLSQVRQMPLVRGVVWGHVHQAFETVESDVLYACTPSTCIQFLPNSETFALDAVAPGFRIFDLDANGRITTQVHRVDDAYVEPDLESTGY